MSADRLFTRLTERLLSERRVTGFHIQGEAQPPLKEESAAFSAAFEGKREWKGGNRNMPWGDWLVESLFPTKLYDENSQSLDALCQDPRIWEIKGFSGKDNYNNSFGRMARPRDAVPEGFVRFMLARWRGKYRGMPQYYFNVEEPEWVCEPLAGRPDIPKTGRTAVSCVMNYGFHWLNDRAHICVILRHLNWSHSWGDVYGGERLLRAVCDELAVLPMGTVTIFANSASMDLPKVAKRYLKELTDA